MVCSSVSRKLLSPFGSLLGLVWCPGGREGGERKGREGEPQGGSEGMYTHLHVLNQCCSVQISAAAFNISAKLIATDKVCGSWCPAGSGCSKVPSSCAPGPGIHWLEKQAHLGEEREI